MGNGGGGGGQAVIYNLKASVNSDCQGMPGGASAALLNFIDKSKSGENALRLCIFCTFH